MIRLKLLLVCALFAFSSDFSGQESTNYKGYRVGRYEGSALNTTVNQSGKVVFEISKIERSSAQVDAHFVASDGLVGEGWLSGRIGQDGTLTLSGNLSDWKMFVQAKLTGSETITATYRLEGPSNQEGEFTVNFRGPANAALPEGNPPARYRGTLTFARNGPHGGLDPEEIVDLDLVSDNVTVRFNGIDPDRTNTGETTFLARLGSGYVVDRGVVVADARGATGAPLYTCRKYSRTNVNCHTPRLSPNRQFVAFATVAGGGRVCRTELGLYWADYVNVRDRNGAERAKFEGYYYPNWLPDGRLLMLGTSCRNAGVWIADAALKTLTRVDGNQIGTPTALPAVSPDGKRVAFVWNKQLWVMTLDAQHELTKVTEGQYSIGAATWSPDGRAFAVILWDVSLPVKAVKLFQPGDEKSVVVKRLAFYPYGPISWQ